MQPTGNLHIGNYLGALKNWVKIQYDYECIFCIVDLHAVTLPQNPKDLRAKITEIAALYLAAGIDPKQSSVMVQSAVPAHAELAWMLTCVTPVGWLERMTQFKAKSAAQESIGDGLLQYPVLMAADILLYQAAIVPVGEDQSQHLELTRDVAQRFNSRFGEILRVPEGVYPADGARIMDLTDPEKKMSTSTSPDMGKVLMTDPPEVVRKQIMSAVTDTGREVRREPGKPGITNLIDIMSVASGRSSEAIEREFEGQGYGTFKAAVAEAVNACLDPIRSRYEGLRADPVELERLLSEGARKAVQASQATLRAMYDRMGFAPRFPD